MPSFNAASSASAIRVIPCSTGERRTEMGELDEFERRAASNASVHGQRQARLLPSGVREERRMKLAERIALITGGGSGLGREIALTFSREGAAVAINDLRREAAEATVGEIQAAGG